jgi:glycosyl transferase family 25
MWEFVEKVVYINLAHRVDRNEHMQRVTKTFGDKVIRFDAIPHESGLIGCAMSHIGVLKMAIENNWKNVLILEDDAEWNNLDATYPKLEKLASNPYDVILLSGGCVISHDSGKLISAQTATAYLVHSNYYQTLLNNLEEGLILQRETKLPHLYANDQYWKHLQHKDNWFITVPLLMYQRPDYSDIEKRYVDYRDHSLLNIKNGS